MPCEISDRDQRIDDFLMNKLSRADAEAFEIHLFGCKECLAELRLREQMIEALKEEHVAVAAATARPHRAKPPVGFITTIADFFRVRPNAWIYAGVAAALLVAVLASPLFRGQDAAEDYAANFTPSPRLESLMKQALRSSDLSFSVASPHNGETFFPGEIEFRWQIQGRNAPLDSPLELKILNNHETEIHSAQVEGHEYRLREPLASGLYYWTLDYRGETLHLGKFFINTSSH